MYEQIRRVVLESSLWNNTIRDKGHEFLLSSEVYPVLAEEADELRQLGAVMYLFLSVMSKLFHEATKVQLNKGRTWDFIRKILYTGIPQFYHEVMLENPGVVPSIYQMSLVKVPDGKMQVIKIDGFNKYGLGYAVLARNYNSLVCQHSFNVIKKLI